MKQTELPYVIGVFRDRALAQQALDELRHAGFRNDQIHLPDSDFQPGGFFDGMVKKWMGDNDYESLESLREKGLSQSEAESYQHELEVGHPVVVVESYDRKQEARDILNRFGAYHESHPFPVEEYRMQLRQEVLQPEMKPVQIGEVTIHKVVVTEEKTITIPIRREEIVIEHHSVLPGASAPTEPQGTEPVEGRLIELAENEIIRIPLYTEEVSITKHPVMAEEVLIGKHTVEETRQYTETVQHEEPRLQRLGNVTIQGDSIQEDPPRE